MLVESMGPIKGDGKIPADFDFEPFVDRLLAEEELYEIEVGGHTVSITLCPKVEINIGGETIETYAVGDGWCWFLEPDEPAASPKP